MLLCTYHATAQQSGNLSGAGPKIVELLDRQVTEKAYLHFDKPYYSTGDTVYFKAYVVKGNNHGPSDINNMLHVELIGPENKIAQSELLQVVDGKATGDFALADSLPGGNYRVRAYTRWMRNGGGNAYFDRTIAVASVHDNKIPESTTAKNKSAEADMQFLPEGGQLLVGITNKVAFKCIGPNGLGMAVKGTVLNQKGERVADFKSQHLGMGYFMLTAAPGDVYHCVVTFSNGQSRSMPLPVTSSGIVVRMAGITADSVNLEIVSTHNYFNQNHDQGLNVLIASGQLIELRKGSLDTRDIKMQIARKRLNSGIVRVTVFSATGQPLTERQFFNFGNDRLDLAVDLDKPQYGLKSSAVLTLSTTSVLPANFSVAVTDMAKVPVDENNEHTIFTDLLLTSDLTGYIEQPNYYFLHNDGQARSDLDLVMLTHGYSRYNWQKLTDSALQPPAWQPELAMEIHGQVKTFLGKPLSNASVNLLPVPSGPPIAALTDSKGWFKYDKLTVIDTMRFVLQAVNAKGSNKTDITYKADYDGAPQLLSTSIPDTGLNNAATIYLAQARKRYDDDLKFNPHAKMLKEVKVKAVVPKKTYRSSSWIDREFAVASYTADDLRRVAGPSLVDNLVNISTKGRAVKALLAAKYHSSTAPLIVVDGTITNAPVGTHGPPTTGLDYINSNDVESVEVFLGAEAIIYGPGSNNGVIVVTTKTGSDLKPSDIPSIGVLPITVPGFYKARQFYAPRYPVADSIKNRPDDRSTVYWQPNVDLDGQGKATLNYFNADTPGIYRVVVEGMDDRGRLGRAVYTYNVK